MPAKIESFHDTIVVKTRQPDADTKYSLMECWPPEYDYYRLADVDDGFNGESVITVESLVGPYGASCFRTEMPKGDLVPLIGKDVKVWFNSFWRVTNVVEEAPRK